jgi:endoglucanase
MTSLRYSIITFLFLVASVTTKAQSVAQQRCDAMEKGMNVSNWLERHWDSDWPNPAKYSKQDLERMQEAGITSIRLPIGFHGVVDVNPPYEVDTAHILFDLVDSVIQWTDELNMKLLIDNHHGWDLSNENWRPQLPMFSHMWSVVAQRYQHLNPDRVMFELMNEPSLLFDKDSLVIMYNDAIDSIRQHTIEHSIVISPHWGGTAMVIPEFEPLADTNLIYTWHVYDPLDFSHQGLTWHNPYFPSGNPFPNADTTFFEGWLYNGWQNVLDWKQTYNKPLFLGEFGLSNYCDSVSVCRWLEYTMTRVKQHHIPWFYWDWQWDFSMFNSQVISEDSIYPCYKYYLGLYGDDTFTDVQQIESESELTLYPNPTSEWFALNVTKPFELAVFDITGRKLLQQKMASSEKVDVSAWKSGIYLVVFKVDDAIYSKRLVVQ